MHEIEFTVARSRKVYKRSVASTFKEYDANALLALCYAAVGKFNDNVKGLLLLWRLLKIPARVFFKMKRAQVNQIYEQLLFISDEKKVFENWLITKLRPRFSLYYFLGPEGSLEDVSTLQLALAESKNMQFHKDGSKIALEELAAILYTKVSPLRWMLYKLKLIDKLKIDFNPNTAERNAKHFKTVPLYKLLAVQLNFLGILNYFEEAFPNIPRGSNDASPYGWAGLIYELAGEKLGSIEQVEKRSVYQTFLFIDKIEFDLNKNK